jgi:hypothetical protein
MRARVLAFCESYFTYDYDYGYAPAVSVGYVARPYWGHLRYYRAAYRPYGYGVGLGGYRPRVAHYSHAGFRSYGMARPVHHGRFR